MIAESIKFDILVSFNVILFAIEKAFWYKGGLFSKDFKKVRRFEFILTCLQGSLRSWRQGYNV